jgi:tetratricopeptide (TPR) repeat protein
LANGASDDAGGIAAELEAGRALHQQGRLGEAERIYVAVLDREPANPDALHLLGMIALQAGQPAAAVDLLSKALVGNPGAAGIYSNRAVALAALGRIGEAVADYDRAIALKPDFIEAHLNRANALSRLRQFEAALQGYDAVVELAPLNAEAYCRRGDCLQSLARADEALASYERAIELNGGHAAAHLGRGNLLNGLGRYEASAASYEAAVALNPANPVAHFNRGNLLRVLQQPDAAIASYDRAIALKPDFAIAQHNRAFCLLQKGELEAGFRAYEWRRKCPTFEDPRYDLDRLWTGDQDLSGKSLFIFPELFLGDMIQFCRYALAAERRGARVTLAAPANMHALLRTLSPTIALIGEDAIPAAFDLQAPLMSLPAAFGTTLARLPVEAGYLHPEPQRLSKWKARIGEGGLRIGVVWQGSTLPYALPLQRSYPLAALRDIAQVPGVRLISLQKHNGLDQLASLPAAMAVESLGGDFDPGPEAFVDTAAAMACCDLVIAMDTSAAHLAGALGVRTWVALPYIADWRWLIDRTDSPWYPSVRLFRQSVRGDWDDVFSRMRAALETELS